MMDIQERYLHAVRGALPAAKADDIVAELRDVLTTRREDSEEALGRPLNPGEASAMLREFGHPLVVAARYRTQQWLIGPDVFPFYRVVLRVVAVISICVQVVAASARIVIGGARPSQIIMQSVGGICMSLIISVGAVTIIFAVLERTGFPAEHVRRWKPEQLAAVKDQRKSDWESAFEIAAGALLLLWWIGAFHLPIPSGGPDFRLELAPVFARLHWPIFALIAVRLIQNVIEWLRPRWTLVSGLLSVATTVAGFALLVEIYNAGQWAAVVPTGMPADKAAELGASLNLGLKIAIFVVGVVWLGQGGQAGLKIWRRLRGRRAAA